MLYKSLSYITTMDDKGKIVGQKKLPPSREVVKNGFSALHWWVRLRRQAILESPLILKPSWESQYSIVGVMSEYDETAKINTPQA